MSTSPVLSIRGLNKAFGALVVAQSIDVDLMPGARVGLIGPNGAGKTTFVNLLTGFLQPDSGTVRLGAGACRTFGGQQIIGRNVWSRHGRWCCILPRPA